MLKSLSKNNCLPYGMNRMVLVLLGIIASFDYGTNAEIINESTIRNMIIPKGTYV
jgi:hypothetical protein